MVKSAAPGRRVSPSIGRRDQNFKTPFYADLFSIQHNWLVAPLGHGAHYGSGEGAICRAYQLQVLHFAFGVDARIQHDRPSIRIGVVPRVHTSRFHGLHVHSTCFQSLVFLNRGTSSGPSLRRESEGRVRSCCCACHQQNRTGCGPRKGHAHGRQSLSRKKSRPVEFSYTEVPQTRKSPVEAPSLNRAFVSWDLTRILETESAMGVGYQPQQEEWVGCPDR
jgi:hypothetical protein